MEVLALTVFLSLCLAGWFFVAFIRQAMKPQAGAWERESLLPLLEDGPPAGKNEVSKPSYERQNDND
jgi:hypothetical protein